MKTLPASEAKNSFGHLLDMAQSAPVAIEKHGRAVAVMMSMEDYEHLEALEHAYWIRAEEGEASGRMSVEESEAFIQSQLNALD